MTALGKYEGYKFSHIKIASNKIANWLTNKVVCMKEALDLILTP